MLDLKLSLAASLVAKQDVKFAQRIQDVADELAKVGNNWGNQPSLQKDSEALTRYNEAYNVVKSLPDEIVNWLGNINPIPRDGQKNNHSASGV